MDRRAALGNAGRPGEELNIWRVSGERKRKIARPEQRVAALHGRSALADLLAPHRVVQPFERQQRLVVPLLHDPTALEHVDPVGVHDRRQPVRDEDGDAIA